MHLTIHNTTNINQLEFPLKISEQFQRWRRVRPNLPTGENSHCRWKNAMPPKAPVDKAKQKERDTRRQWQLISWVKLAKTPPKTLGWNRAKITPLKTNGWSHMLVFWWCIYNLGSGFNCFVTHTWGNDTTIWELKPPSKWVGLCKDRPFQYVLVVQIREDIWSYGWWFADKIRASQPSLKKPSRYRCCEWC